MIRTKVTRKGQTVVPSRIRKEMGIGKNSRLLWSSNGRIITVIPIPRDPIRSLRGYTAGKAMRKLLLRKRKEDEEKG